MIKLFPLANTCSYFLISLIKVFIAKFLKVLLFFKGCNKNLFGKLSCLLSTTILTTMHISRISIVLKILISTVTAMNLSKYSMQIDTLINSTTGSSWLIDSFKLNSKLRCLLKCNLMANCYSITYKLDSISTDNCALYSRYFETSELVSFKNSLFYEKECKQALNFYFFSKLKK